MYTQNVRKNDRNVWYWFIPAVLVFAAFLLWSPQADAKIVVEGDTKFKDEVNDCLTTYRNAEGIVGDVIKELENSDTEHKIINSPDWSNTVNDPDHAKDGTGTGTVTRVDKEKLEELVKKIDELKHKDFCTALLHELWHAVDADRGEWTTDKVDGVKRNEVEATLFQNFVHAIRGVPPRTHYGEDISKHVVIGGGTSEEGGAEGENAEGGGEEQQPQEEQEEASEEATSAEVSTSYNHVAPGEYSEVYATVMTSPGATVEATISGPGVDSAATQTGTADGEGVVRFTWRIVAYGTYNVTGTANGYTFISVVNVK